MLHHGLLQASKMKRANHGHSHLRNRSRKREQSTPSHAVLWVLHSLMLSTRMGEVGVFCFFPFNVKGGINAS